MPTENIAYEIVLKCSHDSSGVYINSDDVPGLHLVGSDFLTMKPSVETAIKTLFKDNRGVDIEIVWLADADVFPSNVLPSKLAIYQSAAA